jgi:hypothetical protein
LVRIVGGAFRHVGIGKSANLIAAWDGNPENIKIKPEKLLKWRKNFEIKLKVALKKKKNKQ